jgi:hypothetical protein
MKTIGINIDGVLRNSLDRFDIQYRKVFIHNPSIIAMNEADMTVKEFTEEELAKIDQMVIEKTAELITMPIDSPDLLNHYKFESKTIEMTADNFMIGEDGKLIDAVQNDINLSPEDCLNNFMFDDYALQIFGQADEYLNAMEYASKIQSIGNDNKAFKVVLLSTCKKKSIPATYSFLALKGCKIKGLIFVDEDYQKWDHCDILIDANPSALQTKPAGKISIKINQPFNQYDQADYSFDHIEKVFNKELLKTITTQ